MYIRVASASTAAKEPAVAREVGVPALDNGMDVKQRSIRVEYHGLGLR